ncbi:MAG TPA: tetratricopeptide repeat protein [Geothrix sp.]|nr:tetratricopeptide repeat protein [Geothrix sp.]
MHKKLLATFICLGLALGLQGLEVKVPAGSPTEKGMALFKQGRYGDAKAVLWQVVGANPKDAQAQAYLGLAINNYDRDADQAIQHLEEAARLEPTRARFQSWLGAAYATKAGSVSLLRAMSWATKSREAFERGVALDPKDVEAHSSLLQYYIQAPAFAGGGLDKAKREIAVIAGLDPYLGLILEGRLAEREKDLGQAEALYRKAIARDPAKLGGYNSLGYVLLKAKRALEAVETFRRAVQLNGSDANAHDSLAEGLLALGQLDASLEEYRRALEVDPYFAASYPSLAQCYLKKNELQKARQAYEKYLELAPRGSQANAARKQLEALKQKGA